MESTNERRMYVLNYVCPPSNSLEDLNKQGGDSFPPSKDVSAEMLSHSTCALSNTTSSGTSGSQANLKNNVSAGLGPSYLPAHPASSSEGIDVSAHDDDSSAATPQQSLTTTEPVTKIFVNETPVKTTPQSLMSLNRPNSSRELNNSLDRKHCASYAPPCGMHTHQNHVAESTRTFAGLRPPICPIPSFPETLDDSKTIIVPQHYISSITRLFDDLQTISLASDYYVEGVASAVSTLMQYARHFGVSGRSLIKDVFRVACLDRELLEALGELIVRSPMQSNSSGSSGISMRPHNQRTNKRSFDESILSDLTDCDD